MIVKRIVPTKPIINLIHHHHHHHLHLLSTNRTHPPQPSKPITTISPPNPDHLLRVCTILYQQQDSPDPRLHSKLHACQSQFDQDNHLTHEFFFLSLQQVPLLMATCLPLLSIHRSQHNFIFHSNLCLIQQVARRDWQITQH